MDDQHNNLGNILIAVFDYYLFLSELVLYLPMLKDKLNMMKRRPSKIVGEQNCYEKKKLIGAGTFGRVYLVVHRKTKKQYALKEVVQDMKYKNRQLSIIAQLDHPNVIEMKDYFFKVEEGECVLHIVMEYMDTSLYALLKGQRQLKQSVPLPFRKIMAFQLFKALYYLQLNNVCHRDLKPPNILINMETCELKICDFGSAKIIEKKENNVSYICSRYYRAPELILNSTSYGCQIDIWSAGCILAELMTLEPIFPGDSSIEQLIEIIKILGTPKKKEVAKFSVENSEFPLPVVKGSDLSKILSRYQPEQLEVDLIKKILVYDIGLRLTPFEALSHPYFQDLTSLEETHKLPHLLNFECLRNKENTSQVDLLQEIHQAYASKHRLKTGDETDVSITKS